MLVIGAGSSGVQIAEELQHAGKRVYLSVGSHDRPPRAIAGVTSAGGWGFSASGMPKLQGRARSTSRSP